MIVRNLSEEYMAVGSIGNARKFRREHKHLMTAFVGGGYKIAVHQTDEAVYKFSNIKNEQIDEVIISPFSEMGSVIILKKREKPYWKD